MGTGETIGLIANIGAIAGINFLAVEVRQDNKLLVAQTGRSNVDSRRLSQFAFGQKEPFNT